VSREGAKQRNVRSASRQTSVFSETALGKQAALARHLEKTHQMTEFDSGVDVQSAAPPSWYGIHYS